MNSVIMMSERPIGCRRSSSQMPKLPRAFVFFRFISSLIPAQDPGSRYSVPFGRRPARRPALPASVRTATIFRDALQKLRWRFFPEPERWSGRVADLRIGLCWRIAGREAGEAAEEIARESAHVGPGMIRTAHQRPGFDMPEPQSGAD